MKKNIFTFIFCFLSLGAQARPEYATTLSFQNRNFLPHRELHPINDQETLEGKFSFSYDTLNHFKIFLEPRIKVDFLDASRNRYVPNDAYVEIYSPTSSLRMGLNRVKWGVSQSYNPTDIINRRDFEDYFYHPEPLGELLIKGEIHQGQWGGLENPFLELMGLPLLLDAPLPDSDSRFAIGGRANGVPYRLWDKSDQGKTWKQMAIALRGGATFHQLELSLSNYLGPQREPTYVLAIDTNGSLRVRPFYPLMSHTGLNAQLPVKNFLFHFEGAYRYFGLNDPRPHALAYEDNNAVPSSVFQFIPGITWSPSLKTGILQIVGEYLGETNHDEKLRNFRPFKNDAFLGVNYDFSNRLATRMELGTFKDLSNKEAVFTLEVSSKIYKEIRATLTGLMVARDKQSNSPLSYFENNSSITLSLSTTQSLFKGKK